MARDQRPRPAAGPRRSALRTPVAIVAVAAVLAVSAVAVRAFAADGRSCGTGVKLSIAAAPDVAPAVYEAATRWAGTNPKVNGQCVRVEVTAGQSGDVAKVLGARAGGQLPGDAGPATEPKDADVPGVWIPESISWLNRIQALDRGAFDVETPSVALTPVVLAMPEQFAASALAGRQGLTAADITTLFRKVGKENVGFNSAEPRRDGAALAGALVLRDALAPSPDKVAAVVGAYRSITVAPDTEGLVKGFKPTTMAVMSEQSVLAYDATAPPLPLTAVSVAQPVTLDYPYAVVTGKPLAVQRAAQRFRTALTSAEYRNIFYREGFRAPDGSTNAGFRAEHGISAEAVTPNPMNDPVRVEEVLSYWSAAKTPTRVLSLVDVTSSMKQPMRLAGGASATRLDVLRKTALGGLSLFDDASELGVWTFGATSREAVPVATLNAAHRAKLTAAVGAVSAGGNDTCGLYEAVLKAYQAMRDGYREGRANTVVVFTDGSNTKPGMSLEALKPELEKVSDPLKPVRVVLLGIGPDARMDELNAIAGYVGGKAFAVKDPEQVNEIFLQALVRA